MKKITYLLTFVVMFLTACSNDGEAPSDSQLFSEGTLLKKMTQDFGNTEGVTDFIYNGNKLSKMIMSNGVRYEYLYTGNLITEILFFENDVLKEKEKMQYSADGKMTEKLRMIMSDGKAYKTEYIYNPDGTVTLKGYSGDFTTQNELYNDRKVYLNVNGSVKKMEKYFLVNGQNHTETTIFTYDDKNNIYNTIVGFKEYKSWEGGIVSDSFNNLINSIMTSTQNSFTPIMNISFTYNSYNYPKTISIDGWMTGEYFY